MGIDELNTTWIKLPEWVGWIFWDENNIFIKWKTIKAWCDASWWNVITLIVNNVNQIISLNCDANQWKTNRCWNKIVDSDTCIICTKI